MSRTGEQPSIHENELRGERLEEAKAFLQRIQTLLAATEDKTFEDALQSIKQQGGIRFSESIESWIRREYQRVEQEMNERESGKGKFKQVMAKIKSSLGALMTPRIVRVEPEQPRLAERRGTYIPPFITEAYKDPQKQEAANMFYLTLLDDPTFVKLAMADETGQTNRTNKILAQVRQAGFDVPDQMANFIALLAKANIKS